MVQDSSRELQIVSLFQLIHLENRLGHDAKDEFNNPYELKSTTSKSCTTARDVSFEMLEGWSDCYWLIARGENLESGFHIKEVFFFHPSMMEEYFQSIRQKLRPDVELRDRTLAEMRRILPPEQLERLNYLISRGLTLNDPHIGGPYIESHSISIDLKRPVEHLRELIAQYPLN